MCPFLSSEVFSHKGGRVKVEGSDEKEENEVEEERVKGKAKGL